MRSTSEALEGNRVKLTVEVDEEELRKAVDDTFRRLQKEVSVPGFRPGKVPRRLLEVRLGPQAIRAEVIRHALPDYYAQAVEEADLDTIAAPRSTSPPARRTDRWLSTPSSRYVRRSRSPVTRALSSLSRPWSPPRERSTPASTGFAEQFAELREVERPARDGDLVTVDVHGVRERAGGRRPQRRRLRLRGRHRRDLRGR